MSAAGIIVDEKKEAVREEEDEKPVKEPASSLENLTSAELKELLQKTVEKEEYEEASRIRDEMNRRKKK
jgi:protein-arginine kinase activator protein McsA